MYTYSLPVGSQGLSTPIVASYLKGEAHLEPFYEYYPHKESFVKQIAHKKHQYSSKIRKVLINVLEKQYNKLENKPKNWSKLVDENTFFITTGHQLNIFSGPLYTHYKILTVIKAAEELNTLYPEYTFVPVYWMAGEDHDLEEIQSVSIFSKKVRWEKEKSGPVGRMSTEGLSALLDGFSGINAEIFTKAYASSNTLLEAVRMYMHQLYGAQGLLCVDGDHSDLKRAFLGVMQEELFGTSIYESILTTSQKINDLGYKTPMGPREINLFYMLDNVRERIVKEEGVYKILNTELEFSEEALQRELELYPERFSPNVALRPLYQEFILPNLSYTGGPAETAYWMQLKKAFDQHSIPFPILLPRKSVAVMLPSLLKKIEKTGLPFTLFMDSEQVIKEEILLSSDVQAPDWLKLQSELQAFYLELSSKISFIDSSLEGAVGAEHRAAEKGLEKIEKKAQKALEQRQEVKIRQALKCRESLFPEQSLQERKENILSIWTELPTFLEDLSKHLDPFDFGFLVMVYND